MNADERDRDLIDHILESIALIEEYALHEGPMAEDAVLRRLETLADACTRLSEAVRARHPAIAWRSVSGFRNVLAHGYLEIRRADIDRVIATDLAELRSALQLELRRHLDAPDTRPT